MEKVNLAREKAKKNIKIADHILTQTYPLVNDPKLLMSVIENVFLSLTNTMAALLHYERSYQRIPPFQDNFESKFNMFKLRVAKKYDIDMEYVRFIYDIKNMIISHRKSPMEFKRKDIFVICSDDYKMHTVSASEVKNHIQKAKAFIQEIEGIVKKKAGEAVKGKMDDPIVDPKKRQVFKRDFLFR